MAFRRRVRAAVVGAAVVATAVVGAPAWPESASGVANVAHRGASRVAPENTLPSVVRAVAERADVVELDVRLTRDRVPVLLHDASLARTTDVETVFPKRAPWLVRDFTLEEVRRLDAGSWKARSYAGARVPTLAAVLGQISRSPSGAYLEIKDPETYGGVAGIGAAVVDTVRRRWPNAWDGSAGRRVMVLSADARFLADFAAAHPAVPVGVVQSDLDVDNLPTFADDVEVNEAGLTSERVGAAQSAGLTVGAWTVNRPNRMARLAQDVDSITTNDPWRLRGVLQAMGSTYLPTTWPSTDPRTPRWGVTTAGRYLARAVTVRARLETADGAPAAWQRAAVQRRVDGRWRTLAVRGTNASGRISVRVAGRAGLVVRVATLDGITYPRARSAAMSVPLQKVRTDLRLRGTRRVAPRGAATLAIRWLTADGRPMSGKAKLLRRRGGEPWRYVRDLSISGGYHRTTVRPGRRTTLYRVRGLATWWRTAAVDDTRVRVVR